MPTDVVVFTVAVLLAFALFAATLYWAERRTRGISPHFLPPEQKPRLTVYERGSPETGNRAAGNSAA
ncbi:MAG TPA: hypothetical protein VFQ27_14830 [Xanthobacteraceae bacterium]|nr:hypothetical protein [Xanthobacteraceae bacterium]